MVTNVKMNQGVWCEIQHRRHNKTSSNISARKSKYYTNITLSLVLQLPTVVWTTVGPHSAAPTDSPPRPAASWPHGCHSGLAGSSGRWWNNIVQLGGHNGKERETEDMKT